MVLEPPSVNLTSVSLYFVLLFSSLQLWNVMDLRSEKEMNELADFLSTMKATVGSSTKVKLSMDTT